ncbi:hypothetical protein GGP41_000701 [Bipolaris sorokiniana]|uniref:Uncharacterized protein n=1 Tax=Cochliobolus sativus TaxID=45130 RepID=A0A8H5ZPK4_COCSA|nr:hypothetical protein GGP41_000701 [Bipolaris sorokiniana]
MPRVGARGRGAEIKIYPPRVTGFTYDGQSLLLAPFFVVFPVTRVGVGTGHVFVSGALCEMGIWIALFYSRRRIDAVYEASIFLAFFEAVARDRGARVDLTVCMCNMDDATCLTHLS